MHFGVLLSLSSRYHSSSVAKRTASLGSVRLLLSVPPLYSFVHRFECTILYFSHYSSNCEHNLGLRLEWQLGVSVCLHHQHTDWQNYD